MYLNEATLLNNIRIRYMKNQIYVSFIGTFHTNHCLTGFFDSVGFFFFYRNLPVCRWVCVGLIGAGVKNNTFGEKRA